MQRQLGVYAREFGILRSFLVRLGKWGTGQCLAGSILVEQIGVFVSAPLPGTLRIAEVDLHIRRLCLVISGPRTHVSEPSTLRRGLFRLYEFNHEEAEAQAIRKVAGHIGDRKSVALENEAWVESVGGSKLTLLRGERNQGVCRVSPLEFACILDSDGWSNLDGLLDPFFDTNPAGFQWLTHYGTVALLISQNGQWLQLVRLARYPGAGKTFSREIEPHTTFAV